MLFFVVLAAAPLPFGSIDQVVLSLWCILLSISMVLVADARLDPFRAKVLIALGLTAILLVAIVYLQMAPPSPLVGPAPIWARAAAILNADLPPVPALAKNLPVFNIGNLVTCGLALGVGVLLGGRASRVRRGLDVFAFSCTAYALYGIISAARDPTLILWTRRTMYEGDVIGTFIYRNTAAVYFAAGAAVSMLLFLQRAAGAIPTRRRTIERFLIRLSKRLDLRTMLYFGCASACGSAVMLSGSRAGFILLLMTLTMIFATQARRLRGLRPQLLWGLVAVGVVLALRLSSSSVDARFAGSGLDDEGRFAVQAATWKLVFEHPVSGVGAGVFPVAFPMVRPIPPDIYGTYSKAFNVPLETAAEYGLPFALLLSVHFGAAIFALWRGGKGTSKLVRWSGLVILLISGVHALIDYSLEIPGFSIVICGLLGLMLAGRSALDDDLRHPEGPRRVVTGSATGDPRDDGRPERADRDQGPGARDRGRSA